MKATLAASLIEFVIRTNTLLQTSNSTAEVC